MKTFMVISFYLFSTVNLLHCGNLLPKKVQSASPIGIVPTPKVEINQTGSSENEFNTLNLSTSDLFAPNAIGIGNANVESVFVDIQGRIYLTTSSIQNFNFGPEPHGISISQDKGQSFFNKSDYEFFRYDLIEALAISMSGQVWVAGINDRFDIYDKLLISEDGGKTFKIRNAKNSGMMVKSIRDVFIDANGKIYVTGNEHFSISSDGGNSFVTKTIPGQSVFTENIYVDQDGTIYLGAYHEFYISRDGGNTFISKSNSMGLNNSSINSVFVDDKRKLYVGTTGGLFVSENGGNTFSKVAKPIDHKYNWIDSVFVDSKGIIYLGTPEGLAISKNGGESFVNKTITDGLGTTHINAVFVDSNDLVYAATQDGISISDNGGYSFKNKTTIISKLKNRNVTDIKSDTVGKLYFGTSDGLYMSPDGGATFTNKTTLHGLGENCISSIALGENNKIYIAGCSGHLSTSTDGGHSFTNSKLFDYSWINSMAIRENGRIYIGANSGLFISTDDGHSFIRKTVLDGLGSYYVKDVFIDKTGTIYTVGDFHGLSVSIDGGNSFSNIRRTSIFSETELASNDGNTIFVDNLGVIYVGTDVGLSISKDRGKTWATHNLAPILSMDFDEFGTFYLGTTIGVYYSSDSGQNLLLKTTSEKLGGSQVRLVHFNENLNKLFAATDNRTLSVSDDGGNTFTYLSQPY
jgi:ligand-binding sensor domain-containing protein